MSSISEKVKTQMVPTYTTVRVQWVKFTIHIQPKNTHCVICVLILKKNYGSNRKGNSIYSLSGNSSSNNESGCCGVDFVAVISESESDFSIVSELF